MLTGAPDILDTSSKHGPEAQGRGARRRRWHRCARRAIELADLAQVSRFPSSSSRTRTLPSCRCACATPGQTEPRSFDVVPVVKGLSLRSLQLADAAGVAVDISHVSTASVVKGYSRDDDGLKHALEGADVVVIPAVRTGAADRL